MVSESSTLRLSSQSLEDEHEHNGGRLQWPYRWQAFCFVPWTSVALISCIWEMTYQWVIYATSYLRWRMRLGDARTCLTFVPWSVCPLCGLVAYTGPPDVALMMPFFEDCCVSAESDWFWFCVFIESVSHQNKLITLNVNVFTGKIRLLLMSHKVFGRKKWRE